MSKINVIACLGDVKNTGVCGCFYDPKEIAGGFIGPKKHVFHDDDLSDENIANTFADLVKAEAKKDRAFPFFGFVSLADSSEEPVMQSFAYGNVEVVREGLYKWLFEFRRGGVSLNNALRSFNDKFPNYGVLFVDAQNTLIGTSKKADDGTDGLGFIDLANFYAYPWKANDGSKLTAYRASFEFEPTAINENIAYAKVDTDILLFKDVAGLIDIVAAQKAVTNTTLTFELKTACGENLFDTYPDEIASTDICTLSNATTGGNITMTTVVKNETLKAWVVTIPTSGNANYPAAGQKYVFKLVGVSELADAGVVGYEGVNTLNVTRPA